MNSETKKALLKLLHLAKSEDIISGNLESGEDYIYFHIQAPVKRCKECKKRLEE